MATVRKRSWKSGGTERTAWLVDYKDRQGERRFKTFKRKKDADAHLDKIKAELHLGTHTPDSQSVDLREAGEQWIRRCEADGLERSTVTRYRGHLKNHILPALGGKRLSEMARADIEYFRDDLATRLSRPMARKVMTSLRQLLSDAQRRGLVAQNVASDVRIKRAGRDKPPAQIPTKDDLRFLLDTAAGRWRPLLIAAVFTGLRASELRGLRWSDLDWQNNLVRVRQRADEYNVIGPPKSGSSYRDVPMTPLVKNTLREWRVACPKGELDLVFPNGVGRVETLSNIHRRGLGPLQRTCGIVDGAGKPRYGLHAFRHFYASWLIDQGMNVKRVQTLMGHSSVQMTFDVYGHLFPSTDDDHEKLAAAELALVS